MPRILSSILKANLETQRRRLDDISARLDLDLDHTDHAAEIDAAIDDLEEAISDAQETLDEIDEDEDNLIEDEED